MPNLIIYHRLTLRSTEAAEIETEVETDSKMETETVRFLRFLPKMEVRVKDTFAVASVAGTEGYILRIVAPDTFLVQVLDPCTSLYPLATVS